MSRDKTMVELLHHYSNPASPWPYEAILRLTACPVDPSAEIQPLSELRRRSPRLISTQVEELVERYVAGDIIRVIAADLQVNRTTVAHHLRTRGVLTRRRPLTPGQVVQAAAAYQEGTSLARIGEHLGVDSSTVWRALIKAGVRMRDTHGRER
jgi:Helix-turn-helix domain